VIVSLIHWVRKVVPMAVGIIGLDIAKQVFQVHGADDEGRAVLKKRLKRSQASDFSAAFQGVWSDWKPREGLTTGRG
jgi:hypothetical protein